MNKFALWIYHREKLGAEKWQYIREVETGFPEMYLDQEFEAITTYKIKGRTTIDAQVRINKIKFKKIYVVYANGFEWILAERY